MKFRFPEAKVRIISLKLQGTEQNTENAEEHVEFTHIQMERQVFTVK